MALTTVDRLFAAQRFGEADSIVRAVLATLALRDHADTVDAAPWLVRSFEIASQSVAPGTVDTVAARAAIALANGHVRRPANIELTARIEVAAARAELLLGRFRPAMVRLTPEPANSLAGWLARARFESWCLTARALSLLGNRDSARVAADSAVATAHRHWPPGYERDVADAELGYVLERATKAAPAVALFASALPRIEARLSAGHPDLFRWRGSYAGALIAAGYPYESLLQYRRTVRVLESFGSPESFILAVTLEQLGAREARLGDLVAARRDCERAVEMFRRVAGDTDPDYGFASWILGGVMRDLGAYDEAARLVRRGIDVMSARLGRNYGRNGEAWHTLATVYREIGRTDSALACLERACAIQTLEPPAKRIEYFNTLGNLANVLCDQGRFAEAQPVADSAVTGMTLVRGPAHQYVAALQLVQATVDRARGHDDSAIVRMERVVAARSTKLGAMHPAVEEALSELAFTRARHGDAGPALTDALEAAGLLRHQRRLLLRGLDERTALAVIARTKWSGLDLAITLAGRPDTPALTAERTHDEIVRQRSLLFDELLLRRRDAAATADRVVDLGQLARVRAEIARMLLSTAGAGGTALDSLSRLETTLESTGLTKRGDISPDAVGLTEVLDALPPRSALVSFMRYQHIALSASAARWRPDRRAAYVVFAATPGMRTRHDLGDAAGIDSLVRAWRLAVSSGRAPDEPGVRRIGRELRRRIIDPWLASVHAAEHLFVVLDGELVLLDPATLPDDRDGYLLERTQRWHRLSSERELVPRLGQAPMVGQGLLAVGGVDFESKATARAVASALENPQRLSSCEALRLRLFSFLPASGPEARSVARAWGALATSDADSAQLLLGAAATEQAFRSATPRRKAVHVATHGFALDDDCDAWAAGASAVFRTLYRSGFVLAGANTHGVPQNAECDGLVTAGEISALDLRGTQWVTLSSCESGLGDVVRGEGVHGLVRAFQLAGARQVVMSLWPVGDENAGLWNASFYRAGLTNGAGVDEAARAASLELLNRRRRAALHGPRDVGMLHGDRLRPLTGPDCRMHDSGPARRSPWLHITRVQLPDFHRDASSSSNFAVTTRVLLRYRYRCCPEHPSRFPPRESR